MPDLSLTVVIPTYNRPTSLRRCLECLAAQTADKTAWEVVVVNDGGSDSSTTVESFREKLRIRYLQQQNAGPATARNNGVAAAEGNMIALLDDDCLPMPEWIEKILLASGPGLLLGGKVTNSLHDDLYAETCQTLIDYLYIRFQHSNDLFFTSNNMVMSKSDFQSIGGFDTGFRTSAGEDREFCVRAAEKGIRLVHVPAIHIGHAHALSLTSFVRLHFKYGRATHTYRQAIRRLDIKKRTGGGKGFYLHLLLYPFKSGQPNAFAQMTLLAVSQAATICGNLYERFMADDKGTR